MKKTIHIISHSHWDREWYLSSEDHHLRLVQLLDDVLDLFQNDPDFKYFHLDGQTILLSDYLAVRPHRHEELRRVIQEGKLIIGPFYILQDAFLISSEANVRNALIGVQESRFWGAEPAPIGYFPDTFGLPGQLPQLVQEMGLRAVAFGRGVKPTGFNNQVEDSKAYQSTYSEMQWQSPDLTHIPAILFANWYSNGNEIPTDKDKARDYWKQKISDMEKFASTSHLLMMNGVDHQPVQKNLSQAIAIAREILPEYNIIHSTFEQYIAAISQETHPDQSVVSGELRSQDTDGWYTLANTASSRIYLKQFSHRLSQRLEQVIEPLACLAMEQGLDYPQDKIQYAWKLLLENYPHDSICGCGVDAIHRRMVERFIRCEEVLDALHHQLTAYLLQFDFSEENVVPQGKHFQVVNTTTHSTSKNITTMVEVDRAYFKDQDPNQSYDLMLKRNINNLRVVNSQGHILPAEISDAGVHFNYDLPEDAFRRPFMARFVKISLAVEDMLPLSVRDFYLIEDSSYAVNQVFSTCKEDNNMKSNSIENDYVAVSVLEDGTINIYDKRHQRSFDQQIVIEESGDMGNEYIFREATGKQRYYSLDHLVQLNKIHECGRQILRLTYQLWIPESADALLLNECQRVIDITNRQSGRSSKLRMQELHVDLSLDNWDRGIHVSIHGENSVKDHRYRVLFNLPQTSETHLVDSCYEWLERSNYVSEFWKNPTNPQPLHHFVAIQNKDKDEKYGLCVATQGLYEYEVTPIHPDKNANTQLAITLLRCVGEMGDWGYFETKESQCIGAFSGNLYVMPWYGEDDLYTCAQTAMEVYVPAVVTDYQDNKHVLARHTEQAQDSKLGQLIQHALPASLQITAIKRHHKDNQTVIRIFNTSPQAVSLWDFLNRNLVEQSWDLVESEGKPVTCDLLEPYKIQTFSLIKE